ncbi:MAG: hypothetical protein ACLU5F_04755, partial [Anaerovoracaceae bacterium]
MYKINILNEKNTCQLEELVKIFLRPDQYEITRELEGSDLIRINESGSSDWKQVGREIYDKLSAMTGKRPAGGLLTGIRPVQLCGELLD